LRVTLLAPGQIEALPRHTVRYRILNQHWRDTDRSVEVCASPEEIHRLVEEGYLLRERLIRGEALERLRSALDEVAERERREQGARVSGSRAFGGLFLRHLLDKHPAFLELLKFEPTLSVARAVLGPLVQIRGLSSRIVPPDAPNSETEWHQHHRYATDPPSPWFVRPHGLDCLIYLDDITADNGPICVRPRTHRDMQAAEMPAETYEDLPDQVELQPPAGSVLMMHATLWHRAKPPTAPGNPRRLLLLNYTPTWMKLAPYGTRPADGLTRKLLEGGDPETLELLGVGGYT
jgi:ectoine hydroxylase-related dioxygenase (phytanoyl-CoA dioxygenase family)